MKNYETTNVSLGRFQTNPFQHRVVGTTSIETRSLDTCKVLNCFPAFWLNGHALSPTRCRDLDRQSVGKGGLRLKLTNQWASGAHCVVSDALGNRFTG